MKTVLLVFLAAFVVVSGMWLVVKHNDKVSATRTWQDAGVLISAHEILTSWNDGQRTSIETSNGYYTVRGVVQTAVKGAQVKVSSDGWLSIDGSACSWRLYVQGWGPLR